MEGVGREGGPQVDVGVPRHRGTWSRQGSQGSSVVLGSSSVTGAVTDPVSTVCDA